eukprot:364475-Chlamydomonas_euryale.AAC.5
MIVECFSACNSAKHARAHSRVCRHRRPRLQASPLACMRCAGRPQACAKMIGRRGTKTAKELAR